MTPRDRTASGRFRILAIANETLDGDPLHQLIDSQAGDLPAEVLVVAPALNSRLRHWLSDGDAARHAAEERLARSVERLDALGILAHGWVATPIRSRQSPTRSRSSRRTS